ncbi:MAG: DoxX family protein [Blastocatellia bacterium]|nr:DoxX family protein [Blastocatellia bacterium]
MNDVKTILKYLLAVFFVAAGVNHFVHPEFYMRIMPPYLPWPSALHLLAGALEAVFGVLLLIPRFQNLAAWGIIAVLIGVFPANLHMAINQHLYPDIPSVFHWIRLPLQFVFIAWAWWYTK